MPRRSARIANRRPVTYYYRRARARQNANLLRGEAQRNIARWIERVEHDVEREEEERQDYLRGIGRERFPNDGDENYFRRLLDGINDDEGDEFFDPPNEYDGVYEPYFHGPVVQRTIFTHHYRFLFNLAGLDEFNFNALHALFNQMLDRILAAEAPVHDEMYVRIVITIGGGTISTTFIRLNAVNVHVLLNHFARMIESSDIDVATLGDGVFEADVVDFDPRRLRRGENREAYLRRLYRDRLAATNRARTLRSRRGLAAQMDNFQRRVGQIAPIRGKTRKITEAPGLRSYSTFLEEYYPKEYSNCCLIFTLLVICKCDADPEFKKQHIRRGKKYWNSVITPDEIKKYHVEIGVPLGGVKREHLPLICDMFVRDYEHYIIACELDSKTGEVIYTRTTPAEELTPILLALDATHCYKISSFGRVFFNDPTNRLKRCPFCHCHYSGDLIKHQCGKRCYVCGGFCDHYNRGVEFVDGERNGKFCVECNVLFKSDSCYDVHLEEVRGTTRCATHFRCPQCDVYCTRSVKGNEHECSKFRCKVCNTFQELEHNCYLKPKKFTSCWKGLFTYDFETKTSEEGILIPVCVTLIGFCADRVLKKGCCKKGCVCFDLVCISRRGADVSAAFASMVNTCCNGMVGIAHNASAFDSHFVLTSLLNFDFEMQSKYTTIGSKIIYMEFKRSIGTVHTIVAFEDSMKYMAGSLRAIIAGFGVTTKKEYFPFRFMNEVVNCWNYNGPIPEISWFDESVVGTPEFVLWYEAKQDDDYNFKEELNRYCAIDTIALAEVCCAFECEMYSNFDMPALMSKDVHTIASLSLAIFKQGFLKENTMLAFNKRMNFTAPNILLKEQLAFYLQHGYEPTKDGFGYCRETGEYHILLVCSFHGCSECFCADENNLIFFCSMAEAEQNVRTSLENIIEPENLHVQCKEEITYEPSNLECVSYLPINDRDALYGGNTQVFCNYADLSDCEAIDYVDVNSLYPWVMVEKEFPIYGFEVLDVEYKVGVHYGLVKCSILPPDDLIHPVLPVRSECGKLIFSLCRSCINHADVGGYVECGHTEEERALYGTWTSVEIDYAVSLGYRICKTFEIKNYLKRDKVFREYMTKVLKGKYESSDPPQDPDEYATLLSDLHDIGIMVDEMSDNPAKKLTNKIAANSSWGKYAQREGFEKRIILNDTEDDFNLLQYLVTSGSDVITEIIDLVDAMEIRVRCRDEYVTNASAHVNPTVAAFVTSHARLKLHSYLSMVNENAIYSDTDSIITKVTANEAQIPTKNMLGCMENEMKQRKFGYDGKIQRVVCLMPKSYCLEIKKPDGTLVYETHLKGIKKNVHSQLSFDSLIELLEGRVESYSLDNSRLGRTKYHEIVSLSSVKKLEISGKNGKRSTYGQYGSRPFGHRDVRIRCTSPSTNGNITSL